MEKAAYFMHLNIVSLVTEIVEAQLIYQTVTLPYRIETKFKQIM